MLSSKGPAFEPTSMSKRWRQGFQTTHRVCCVPVLQRAMPLITLPVQEQETTLYLSSSEQLVGGAEPGVRQGLLRRRAAFRINLRKGGAETGK